MRGNGLLANEVLRWRLGGALAWHLVLVTSLHGALRLATSITWPLRPISLLSGLIEWGWMARITAHALVQALALLSHAALVATQEPMPVRIASAPRALPAVPMLLLSKLLGRLGSPAAAAAAATYLAAHAAPAMLSVGRLTLFSRPARERRTVPRAPRRASAPPAQRVRPGGVQPPTCRCRAPLPGCSAGLEGGVRRQPGAALRSAAALLVGAASVAASVVRALHKAEHSVACAAGSRRPPRALPPPPYTGARMFSLFRQCSGTDTFG
jgi:hypothetical protein